MGIFRVFSIISRFFLIWTIASTYKKDQINELSILTEVEGAGANDGSFPILSVTSDRAALERDNIATALSKSPIYVQAAFYTALYKTIDSGDLKQFTNLYQKNLDDYRKYEGYRYTGAVKIDGKFSLITKDDFFEGKDVYLEKKELFEEQNYLRWASTGIEFSADHPVAESALFINKVYDAMLDFAKGGTLAVSITNPILGAGLTAALNELDELKKRRIEASASWQADDLNRKQIIDQEIANAIKEKTPEMAMLIQQMENIPNFAGIGEIFSQAIGRTYFPECPTIHCITDAQDRLLSMKSKISFLQNRLDGLNKKIVVSGLSESEKEEYVKLTLEKILLEQKEANKKLESMSSDLSSRLNTFEQISSENSKFIKKLKITRAAELIERRAEERKNFQMELERQETIAMFNAASGLADVIQTFGGEKYAQIGKTLGIAINLGKQAFAIASQYESLSIQSENLGLATSAAMSVATFNYIGLAFTAVQMFSSMNQGPSPEQQMMKQMMRQLSAIFDQLQQISEQLSVIDKRIYGLTKLTETVLDRMSAGFSEMAFSLQLISKDIKNIDASIKKLETHINDFQLQETKRNVWITKAILQMPRNDLLIGDALCKGFNNIELQEYKNRLAIASSHVVPGAFNINAMKDKSHFDDILDTVRANDKWDLSGVAFDGFGNYLFNELVSKNIVDKSFNQLDHLYNTPTPQVPNMVDVYLGVRAYAEILACYPKYKNVDTKGSVIRDTLIKAIVDYIADLERLSNPRFLDYVADLYHENKNKFEQAYRYELIKFIKAENKNLKDATIAKRLDGHFLGLNPDDNEVLWGESTNAHDFGKRLYPKELLFGGIQEENLNLIDLLFGENRQFSQIKSMDNNPMDQTIIVDNHGLKEFFITRCKNVTYLYDCLLEERELEFKSAKELNITERYDIYLPMFILVKENIDILQSIAHGNLHPKDFSLQYSASYGRDISFKYGSYSKVPHQPGSSKYFYNAKQYYAKILSCSSSQNYEFSKVHWSLCELRLIVTLKYLSETITTHLVRAMPFSILNGISHNGYPFYYSSLAPICEGQGEGDWDVDENGNTEIFGKYPVFKSSLTNKFWYNACCDNGEPYCKVYQNEWTINKQIMPRAGYLVGDNGYESFKKMVTPTKNPFKNGPWDSSIHSWIVPDKYCYNNELTTNVVSGLFSETKYLKFTECQTLEKIRLLSIDHPESFRDLVQKAKLTELEYIKKLQAEFYFSIGRKIIEMSGSDGMAKFGKELDFSRLLMLAMIDMVFPTSVNIDPIKVLLKQDGLHNSQVLSQTFLIAVEEVNQNIFAEQLFSKLSDQGLIYSDAPLYDYYQSAAIPTNNVIRKNVMNTFLDSFTEQYYVVLEQLHNVILKNYYKFSQGFTEQASLNYALEKLVSSQDCKGRFTKFEACYDELDNTGYQIYDCDVRPGVATKDGCDIIGAYPESKSFEFKITEANRAFRAIYSDDVEAPRALIDDIVRHVRNDNVFEYAKRIIINSPMMYDKFNNIFIKYTERNLTDYEWSLAKAKIDIGDNKYTSLLAKGEGPLFTTASIEEFIRERTQAIARVTNVMDEMYDGKFSGVKICNDINWMQNINIWQPKIIFEKALNDVKKYYNAIIFNNTQVDATKKLIVSNNGFAALMMKYGIRIDQIGGGKFYSPDYLISVTSDIQNITTNKIFNFEKSNRHNYYEIFSKLPDEWFFSICNVEQRPSVKCVRFAANDRNSWPLLGVHECEYNNMQLSYNTQKFDGCSRDSKNKWQLVYFANDNQYGVYNIEAKKFISIDHKNQIELIDGSDDLCKVAESAKLNLLPIYYGKVPQVVTSRDIAIASDDEKSVYIVDSFDSNDYGGKIRKNIINDYWQILDDNIGATRIVAAPNNTLWIINKKGGLYEYYNSTFSVRMHDGVMDIARAIDITVNANGTVFALAIPVTENGDEYPAIFRFIRGDSQYDDWRNWKNVASFKLENPGPDDARLSRIEVSPDGTIWLIKYRKQYSEPEFVYSYKDGQLKIRGGFARDITICPDGNILIIDDKNNTIRKNLGGNIWDLGISIGVVDGNIPERIKCGPDGTLWVVNNKGNIYTVTKNGVIKKLGMYDLDTNLTTSVAKVEISSTPRPTMPRLKSTINTAKPTISPISGETPTPYKPNKPNSILSDSAITGIVLGTSVPMFLAGFACYRRKRKQSEEQEARAQNINIPPLDEEAQHANNNMEAAEQDGNKYELTLG